MEKNYTNIRNENNKDSLEDTQKGILLESQKELQVEITFLRKWNKSIQAKLNEVMTERNNAVKQKAELEEKYTEMRLLAIRLFMCLCLCIIIIILLII